MIYTAKSGELVRAWIKGVDQKPHICCVTSQNDNGTYGLKNISSGDVYSNVVACQVQKLKKSKKQNRSKSEKYEHKQRTGALNRAQAVIVPSTFQGVGKPGDFLHECISKFGEWMLPLLDPSKVNHFYLFNDNYMEFARVLQAWMLDPDGKLPYGHPGGGNASVRPFQFKGVAIGISTGPGYTSLTKTITIAGMDKTVREWIDINFRIIAQHIAQKLMLKSSSNESISVYFSCDPDDNTKIGFSIFAGMVGEDVAAYISMKLKKLPHAVNLEKLKLRRAQRSM